MNRTKYWFSVSAVILLTCLCSCNQDKVYGDEMYKNSFALISSDDYNIQTIEHDLDKAEATGYVAVSCGGTLPTEKDIHIILREDMELFDRYNHYNFELESEYAKLVPPANYSIDNFTFTLPAGKKGAKLPVRIRPEGLSPDSTYFISLKVDNFTEYEVNPDKADILYRPIIKNFWATQRTAVSYRFRAVHDGVNLLGSKRLFPLTHRQTRVTVGNLTAFTADTASINTISMIIDVEKAQGEKLLLGKKYPATVKPYGRVTILPPLTDDPEFANIFYIEFDGYKTYKTFLLNYRYQLPGSADIHEAKEELRLEFMYEQ